MFNPLRNIACILWGKKIDDRENKDSLQRLQSVIKYIIMIPVEVQERIWTSFMRSDFCGRIYKVDYGFAGLP